MALDKIGIIIIFGIISLIISYFFKRKLLKGIGWLKQFAIGSSFYLVISSMYFAITGTPFWTDNLDFYRFVVAIGSLIYLIFILENYGIKLDKLIKKK